MIEDCKYSLRHLLKSLEGYKASLDNNHNMEYYKKLLMQKNLTKMSTRIREYLSLPIEEPKKRTLSEIFNRTKGFLKNE